MRVGFIGLGDQGLPMAGRIGAAGFPLTVWARRPEAAATLTGVAEVATSPAGVGRASDVVGICVFDGAGVREVLFGPDGVAHGLAEGGVVVVHTTLAPEDVRDIAVEAAAAGLHVLDAPVSGGRVAAAAGGLTVMVGGPLQVLDRVRQVLATYATDVVHLGGVGAGQRAKLLNNVLFAAQAVLADDALRLGVALGLDPEGLAAVLATGSSSSVPARMRYGAGSLAALAPTRANPTLVKDVGLFARALPEAADEDLLRTAQRFVAAMRAAESGGS
jgi:3-hydroxyisobutyrate dehydrogenase-like beta-hydroxyacid dehydrogenase